MVQCSKICDNHRKPNKEERTFIIGSFWVALLPNRIGLFGYVELLATSKRVFFYCLINEIKVVVAARYVDDNAFELNW